MRDGKGYLERAREATPLAPDEIDQLMSLLGRSDQREVKAENDEGVVRAFIRDNEIGPGRTLSIEVCSIYRLYTEWHGKFLKRPVLAPHVFARNLRLIGFRRRQKQTMGRNNWLIEMGRHSAARLRAWLKLNPDAPEDRAKFSFQRMQDQNRRKTACTPSSP